MDRMVDCDLSFPSDLRTLQSLNPFAVEYRYDLLDDQALPGLNRAEMRDLVRRLRAWAEKQVG